MTLDSYERGIEMTNKEADGDIHGECAAEISQLEIALHIKTEEHDN